MNYKRLVVFLVFFLLFVGCNKPQEEVIEQKDKTITELSIPGLSSFCVDEAGEFYYYAANGDSTIYKCAMDGTPVAQFLITTDVEAPETYGYIGEEPPVDALNFSALCMYGDTLYFFRGLKSSLLELNVTTGESRLVATLDGFHTVLQMAAGEHTLMLPCFTEAGKQFFVYHLDTAVLETVPVERMKNMTHGSGDSYWLNVQDEDGSYYFQEYHADTGELSEEYVSNFTYELSDLVYDDKTDLMYGMLYSAQYVCFHPREPKKVSRFTAQPVYVSPANPQIAEGRLYVPDGDTDKVYYFDTEAYVTWNEPLKGYVTSELSTTEWAGYNIDLEVIDWEELALKVLAEDKDYDFVIMNTDMAEATALRDAMAYLPIPEDVIEIYWAECWPCVKQGATYNGDIWMLPLEAYASGLVYNEQNLNKYGLSIENIKTMPDLCEAAKVLHANGEFGWYNLQPMQGTLLQNYLWKYRNEDTINFDTKEFREILNFLYRERNVNEDYSNAFYRNSYINFGNVEHLEEEFSLSGVEREASRKRRGAARVFLDETGACDTWSFEKYLGAEGIRVCNVPGMFGEEETVQVGSQFLVLNPNSENKEALLSFVKEMSELYIANPATFLSSNTERYVQDVVMQDVCELFRKGEMVFGWPDGLFTSYYLYAAGQVTDAEEVIKELNRVVNMYYGE